jgi:glycosyltransferase involved in cell wall biosynthesis
MAKSNSILYLSVYDPHFPVSGAGIRGMKFLEYFSAAFEVDLVYIEGSGQKPTPDLEKKIKSNLLKVRSKIKIPFDQFAYFIWSQKLYRSALRLLETKSYDWIVCDYGLSGLYGKFLSAKYNVPFIYCSHNIEYLTYWDKVKTDFRRLPLTPYIYWAEKNAVKQSDILVAITKEDADFYRKKNWVNEDKVVVVPQGFDGNLLNPDYSFQESGKKIVLFCGNYAIQQNREAAYVVYEKIVDKVAAEFPDVVFRFVGANPPRDIMHPNIEFVGFVRDYFSILRQADVFISPTLQGRGFPTKIVEALACGKQIISTPIGVRAIERDYQSLHVCEISDFANQIIRVLQESKPVDPTDFARLREHYSWEKNILHLIDFIKGQEIKNVSIQEDEYT